MTTPDGKCKVFISWSGELSKAVAIALQSWLRFCSEARVFMSSTDIQLGDRALNTIRGELEQTDIGLIVLTQENMTSPWVNFEAGAISKTIGTGEATPDQLVIPVLVDIRTIALVKGPLTQFQAALHCDEEGFKDIARRVSEIGGDDPATAKMRMDTGWPRFAGEVEKALSTSPATIMDEPPRADSDMLEEILVTMRTLVSRVRSLERRSYNMNLSEPEQNESGSKGARATSGTFVRPTESRRSRVEGIAQMRVIEEVLTSFNLKPTEMHESPEGFTVVVERPEDGLGRNHLLSVSERVSRLVGAPVRLEVVPTDRDG